MKDLKIISSISSEFQVHDWKETKLFMGEEVMMRFQAIFNHKLLPQMSLNKK